MEWRDPRRRPICCHQIELPSAPLTQWNGREKGWFGSFLRGWSSCFKAMCLAEALTGLLSALDVHPVMSLWRMWAVLAGSLRLHCTGVETSKSVASTALWGSAQRCLSRLDWNVLTRKPQCDEGTAAVSRLDVHIHAYYMTAEGSVDVCVCTSWGVSCGRLVQIKVWVCVTDGSNNDQIALVMETAQFVMAS